MFAVGTVDDLVVPRPRSTTGRALASMVRRRTFERLKALARAGSSEASVRALAAAFDARLPGDPHAISDALSDAAIGVPIRAGLDGDADALELGIDRLLVALGDRPRPANRPARTEVALGVRVVQGDVHLERLLRLAPTEADGHETLEAVRAAVAELELSAPAVAADLGRFASVILATATPPAALPAFAVGVAVVPVGADRDTARDAVIASLAVGRLHALVDGRTYDDALLTALRPAVAHAATQAVGRADGPLAGVPAAMEVEPSDPLADVLAELRALAEERSVDR